MRNESETMKNTLNHQVNRWNSSTHYYRGDFDYHMQRIASTAVFNQALVLGKMTDVYIKLTNGEAAAMMKLGFGRWAQRVLSLGSKKRRGAAVKRAAYKMCNGKMTANLLSVFSVWRKLMAGAKAKTDIRNVVGKWELGESKGICLSVFQAWQRAWSKFKRGKRQSMAVQAALMQSMGEAAKAMVMTAYLAWHKRVLVIKLGFEADQSIMSLRNDLGQKIAKGQKEAERNMAVAMNNINMTLRKWEGGDRLGSLQFVLQTWSQFTVAKRSAQRSKAGAALQVQKWLEGEARGLLHKCYSTWQKMVAEIVAERVFKQKVGEAEAKWDAHMKEVEAKHAAEIDDWKTEAEKQKELVHKTVDSVIKKWVAGDVKGLMISTFQGWSDRLNEKKAQEKRKRQVKDAVMRSLGGAEAAAVKMTFTDWAHVAKLGGREKLVKSQAAEEQAKWEQREMEWIEQHDKVMHRARCDLIMREQAGKLKGFCMGLLRDWRLIVEAVRREDARSKTVQSCVKRFLLGKERGAYTTVFPAWRN